MAGAGGRGAARRAPPARTQAATDRRTFGIRVQRQWPDAAPSRLHVRPPHLRIQHRSGKTQCMDEGNMCRSCC